MLDKKKPRGFANKQVGDYKPTTQNTSFKADDVTEKLNKVEAEAKAKQQAQAEAEAEAKQQALGRVKVIHGATDGIFALVGIKISTVRASLVDAFNIPADAISFINGELKDAKYILKDNDTLEFIRAAGVKGGL